MMEGLADRGVLVSGGSSGVGAACSRRLASDEASIVAGGSPLVDGGFTA